MRRRVRSAVSRAMLSGRYLGHDQGHLRAVRAAMGARQLLHAAFASGLREKIRPRDLGSTGSLFT